MRTWISINCCCNASDPPALLASGIIEAKAPMAIGLGAVFGASCGAPPFRLKPASGSTPVGGAGAGTFTGCAAGGKDGAWITDEDTGSAKEFCAFDT